MIMFIDFNYVVFEDEVAVVYIIVWVLGFYKKSEENVCFPPTMLTLFLFLESDHNFTRFAKSITPY